MEYFQQILTSAVGGTLGGLIALWGERHKFFWSEKLEATKFANALRMAAIDKRLQAHQEAFELWSRLSSNLFAEEAEVRALQSECATWWFKNCLYLEPQAREAFRVAYASAPDHRLVCSTAQHDEKGAKDINRSFMRVYGAGEIIVRAVSLPGLSDETVRYLKGQAQKDAPHPEGTTEPAGA